MKQRFRKLLFSLLNNSRITTKQLSKELSMSQQTASYTLRQLKSKKIIKPVTIVDGIKLGYSNIIVGVNLETPRPESKQALLSILKNNPTIVNIEEGIQGADFVVEYSTKNLSAFHKSHAQLMEQYGEELSTKFMFPVIVKHAYSPKYLIPNPPDKHSILHGDRILQTLTNNERLVLKILVQKPDTTLTNLAEKTELSIKTITSIKKILERKGVIKGYTCMLDHKQVGIHRELLFLKLKGERIYNLNGIIEHSRILPNVVGVAKIIGPYNIMIVLESLKPIQTLSTFRERFPISDYFVIPIAQRHKESYLSKEALQQL